ncbi:MAG: hemolysin family protein [Dysgonamonadaceae bacterium]|jgi:CBS domain containing-hemolysin-like protein|nr:hemolysin family protein [Dysgonamonadaceae bacterium]
MLAGFIFTIFLVFLNGFFVAAEFAIVKVRASQIEVKKGAGKTVTKVAKNVVGNLDAYLAATQLGVTLASLGLGWVGEDVFTKIIMAVFGWFGAAIDSGWAHKLAIPVAFLAITMLHIVLGELAPKSLAIRKPTQVTFAVALPLKAFYLVFSPFIWLLNNMANVLLKMIGLQPVHEQEDIHSEEELKVIIAESQKGGVIEETEKELIQNVFSLGDRKIQTLMTPRNELVWIDLNASKEEIRRTILDNKHTAYPLCEDNLENVAGFVYSKDLIGDHFDAALDNLRSIARPVQLVVEFNKAYQVLEKFQQSRIYQALIVDEYGSVAGFVTLNDILDALVGDISETDEFEYDTEVQADGSIVVDGQIPFVEMLEKIGLDDDVLPKDFNYVTLSGYVLDKLERIPEEGDSVEWENYRFSVVAMDNNRIDKIKIVKNS